VPPSSCKWPANNLTRSARAGPRSFSKPSTLPKGTLMGGDAGNPRLGLTWFDSQEIAAAASVEQLPDLC